MIPLNAALVAGAATVIVAMIAIWRTHLFDPERVLADRNAVRVVRQLLANPVSDFRSFAIIRHHIGGYSDDDLRKLLVRAGAIRVISADDREMWILVERMVKRTKRGDAFYWKIDQIPQTPSDADLFPAKLQERETSVKRI